MPKNANTKSERMHARTEVHNSAGKIKCNCIHFGVGGQKKS